MDKTWKTSKEKQAGWETTALDDRSWSAAKPVARYGEAPWGIVDATQKQPLVATPFSGTCNIPGSVNLSSTRVSLEMDELMPEAAARVTVNGKDAGGFIGKPFRVYVTRHLKHGSNAVKIEPFAPRSAWLDVLADEEQ